MKPFVHITGLRHKKATIGGSKRVVLSGYQSHPLSNANEKEAFVAVVLVVLLLKHDTWEAIGVLLLGGDVLPKDDTGNGDNRVIVLGIRPRTSIKVGERHKFRRVEDDDDGGVGGWWRRFG
ncbi:hypothetical protein RJT34_12995 [Clitoria ternatea]|uniref:Uncharacterized protein n=1 Tax=Clitoria ternatea TaxID=43366 RepID=A0AAN9JMS0_CLITE